MTPKRILVVDDDRGMVDTLCDILELRGWETLRAYDGLAATEIAAREAVDVVLMDVRMPQLDGVQALKRIRGRRPSTRVVLMTAFAAHDLLAQAERDGALRIMRKPVDVPELLALLESAVSRQRSVLVVDDDPAYLQTMSELLATHGVEATTARSLNEALARLEQHPPGAVLLDLKLAGVDMAEHLVAFREISPSVLLVLHSGYDDELSDAVRRAPRGVIDAAFTKPLPIDRLLEVLDGRAAR